MASFKQWFFEGAETDHAAAGVREGGHAQHPWYKVLCLTGVDYFSTLGYQPGIAALAAGAVAPVATLILVLLTLFGAVPVYGRVARESPHGEGSIAMLERLMKWWQGKLFVLVLLGFAATDFIITITLSAADATAHIIENPYLQQHVHGMEVPITLGLIGLLGAVFLKGFKEAMGIAVGLVLIYLGLNLVVIGVAFSDILHHPEYITRWRENLHAASSSPVGIALMAAIIFPKLALGLSGFETGVAVMPLVKGGDEHHLEGRISNTRKLLLSAAVIMSFYLMASSFVTTVAIPHEQFEKGGEAYGRALAYLAHHYLGDAFGTAYDVSTITILWFAGASAMAALLNLVPRYLPRYGMAPAWARASRPLTTVFMVVAFAVTLIFHADVEAQGGAYATGVLVLITSASTAATLSAKRRKQAGLSVFFGVITLIFLYTTAQNIHERPEGIRIAAIFILAIILISLFSRLYRSTELRVDSIDMDELAQQLIRDSEANGQIYIVANQPDERDALEYILKEKEQRTTNHIPPGVPVIFLEVSIEDASDFSNAVTVNGEVRHGYKILRVCGTTVPNTIAAVLLRIRDMTGLIPHVYFGWSEGNPFMHILKYVAFGEGDTAPVTHEVLRQAEPDPNKRPAVHVG